jgi:hypothetical protein
VGKRNQAEVDKFVIGIAVAEFSLKANKIFEREI